jgi:hypothetical protein
MLLTTSAVFLGLRENLQVERLGLVSNKARFSITSFLSIIWDMFPWVHEHLSPIPQEVKATGSDSSQ